MRPMLGDLELSQVQRLEQEEDQLLVRHRVPGLEGDFLQGLGRRGTRIGLTGVLTGPESRDVLKDLRGKLREIEPVTFVSDIATATQVDRVLIEDLEVRELAGKPERFEVTLVVREFTPPPAEETEAPPEIDQEIEDDAADITDDQVEEIDREVGTLEVRVDLGGDEDLTGFVVRVEGDSFTATSSEPEGNVYRFENVPAGDYTVTLEMP